MEPIVFFLKRNKRYIRVRKMVAILSPDDCKYYTTNTTLNKKIRTNKIKNLMGLLCILLPFIIRREGWPRSYIVQRKINLKSIYSKLNEPCWNLKKKKLSCLIIKFVWVIGGETAKRSFLIIHIPSIWNVLGWHKHKYIKNRFARGVYRSELFEVHFVENISYNIYYILSIWSMISVPN